MSIRSILLAGILLIPLGACAVDPNADQLIADPLEDVNRTIHTFNKGVDTAVLQPVTAGYNFVMPTLFRHLLENASNHLALPATFANHVLQGEADLAVETLGRFTINTVGGLGLLDPATEGGLPMRETDFGITLAKWGVGEGAYIELPLLGPSTARDAFGIIVDNAFQPTTYISGGSELTIATATVRGASIVEARDRNAGIIDELLYNSDDSYVSLRSSYIQNRRREVSGGKTDVDALPDLFSE